MRRFTRQLAAVEGEIKAAQVTTSDIATTLNHALAAACNCQAAYLTAPHPIRRQMNQGCFEKLFMDEDGTVDHADLSPPFGAPSWPMARSPRRNTPKPPPDGPERPPAGSSGVRPIRLHDIRHTYTTLAMDEGINPKIVSDRDGHANVTVTQQIYTHRSVGRDREAAAALADLIEQAMRRPK